MIKAGIFDIGGVLQIQDVNGPLRRDVAKTFNVSEDTFEEFRKEMEPYLLVGAMEEIDYWKEFVKRTGSTAPIPQESLLLREYTKNFSINEETLEIVKKLKEQGMKLACLTDTQKPHTDFNKSKGLYDLFEIKIFSHDVGMKKPELALYKMCLEKLEVSASDAFYVDDRESNLIPAKDLGMKTILFINPSKLKQELIKLGILK